MGLTTFSIGRDTQLVVVGPGGRVDISHVTGFESRQLTAPIRVSRLDGSRVGPQPAHWVCDRCDDPDCERLHRRG